MSLPGNTALTTGPSTAPKRRWPSLALKGLAAGAALLALSGCVADGYYATPAYSGPYAYSTYPYYDGYGYYGAYPYYVGIGGYYPYYGWGHGYWHGHYGGWSGGHWGGGHWGGGHWGGHGGGFVHH
ncbi:hypothetical protein UAJ10_29130 [Nitrospirillum sp. BR 11164]|uniref:hypothetical protein n=1 Tax=Nitrospirillum sp. BR 11164 TaxID=3104324 RepID=UPI002AFF0C9A|nr:hypothetical protein [Nitrospirillum sp. BR 11164]MEA1653066.1 hypothetical protein [Nitrospirillum sp. BR 11164]